MKKFLSLLFILIGLNFIFASNITLQSFKGIVQLKLTPQSEWIDAKEGMNLNSGSLINTGFKSNAIIKVNGSLLEVKQLTQISVASLIESNNVITDVELKYGKIKAVVEPAAQDVKTNFKVRSANSTASVRGTIFSYGDSYLYVERGTVLFESKNGDYLFVQEDEEAIVKKFKNIQEPFSNKSLTYNVDTNPIGLSATEKDGNEDPIGKQFKFKKATAIIRINLKK
ncbi:MAG TPA: FecR domain-containing protein [Spirochaetota bacterium]|mgnify:FL=1|nr:FecR domain-containing protein [Spirochaetota bacterium]HOL57749.1 FecR domain-containing protein [Spirochaetota bacterium]HPP04100.1 FecR domain-containing protein [Spirochaetota bacterium]